MLFFVKISSVIFFLVLKYSFVHCDDYLCHYLVNKSDQTLGECINNECQTFVDPYSIMVQPKNCKTKSLSLAFSTYKNYSLFLNRLNWKLGDLFSSSKFPNDIRQLRIYIQQIDMDDQPIDHHQLNRLGIHIDLYQLYLQNITKENSLYQLIHYQPNDPQWDIINIQFLCHSLIRLDENSCSIHILPPSFFAPRRPLLTTEIIPLLSTIQYSSSSSSSTEQSNERSIDLILIIFLPLLILIIISILVSIYIIRNRSSKKDLTSLTPRSSSISSISNHLDSNNGLYAHCRTNAKPYQVSRLPSPHIDSLYKEAQTNF